MLSVLLSDYEKGFKFVATNLKKYFNKNTKVVVMPWTFPNEINSDILINDFFKEGSRRYDKHILPLIELGISKNNITILDCYKDNTKRLKNIINTADVLVLPGGNPEMLYTKVVQDTEILYEVKHFKGIIIGASAGTELQLKRYFITAKNNYYKYFAFYDGFGVIDDPFYIDVHSINNKKYLDKLQRVANDKRKNIYAIFDNGAMIYNRKTKKLDVFGNVMEFNPKE